MIAFDRAAISSDAAWLRCRIHGVPVDLRPLQPEQRPLLPDPVRRHLALWRCDCQVRSGGIRCAVEQLRDPEWAELDGALRDIAPSSCASILRAGFALLLGDDSTASRRARREAVAARHAMVESELREVDRQYRAICHRVAVALAEHRLRHRELFATLDPRKASLPGDPGSR